MTHYTIEQLTESEEGWYLFDSAWKNWKKMYSLIDGDSLLDLGCGSGISIGLVRIFSPNISVQGIEGNNDNPIWKERSLNIYSGNIYDTGLGDNSIDTVWSSHVLEHLNDPSEMIKESYRVCRNKIIHSVPVGNVNDKNLGSPHLHIFNRKSFRQLFDCFEADQVKLHYVEDTYMASFVVEVNKKK